MYILFYLITLFYNNPGSLLAFYRYMLQHINVPTTERESFMKLTRKCFLLVDSVFSSDGCIQTAEEESSPCSPPSCLLSFSSPTVKGK